MERLTDAEIAELRRLVKIQRGPWPTMEALREANQAFDRILDLHARLLDEVEHARALEPYSLCPVDDCGKRGRARRIEETNAGVHTCALKNGEFCHRDVNRYTDAFACPDGHSWVICYRRVCQCSSCLERAER